MKIRFYLFDYFTFADVEWGNPVLPQKGDAIFLDEVINLEDENSSNAYHVRVHNEDEKQAIKVKLFKGCTFQPYRKIINTQNFNVISQPIWRVIENTLTPCFLLREGNPILFGDVTYRMVNTPID